MRLKERYWLSTIALVAGSLSFTNPTAETKLAAPVIFFGALAYKARKHLKFRQSKWWPVIEILALLALAFASIEELPREFLFPLWAWIAYMVVYKGKISAENKQPEKQVKASSD